jgi:uncharacterized membrane protein
MDKWLYRTMIVLAVIGLLVAAYMTIYKWTSNNAMCLGSGDCGTVNASKYSEVNGVPVALIGLLGYASILGVLVLEKRKVFLAEFFEENATLLTFGLALTGFLFTLWLIYVEVALIKALCPFCLTSQVVMTIIFILSIIRLVRQPNL